MVNFTKLAATAKRLIEKNGRTVTITKDDRTPADPSMPWLGPDDVPTSPDGLTFQAKVAFVPATGGGLGNRRQENPSVEDLEFKQGLVAHGSLPAGTDLLTFNWLVDGLKVYRLESVEELKPADTELIYTLELAR